MFTKLIFYLMVFGAQGDATIVEIDQARSDRNLPRSQGLKFTRALPREISLLIGTASFEQSVKTFLIDLVPYSLSEFLHSVDAPEELISLPNTVQDMRYSLKRMRKWKTAHKSEVALVKCVAKYFKEPLPDILGRSADSSPVPCEKCSEQNNDADWKKTNNLTPGEKGDKNNLSDVTTQLRQLNEDQVDSQDVVGEWVFRLHYCYQLLSKLYMDHVYSPFFLWFWENKLFTCSREYVLAKFWDWVDDAPDPEKSSEK